MILVFARALDGLQVKLSDEIVPVIVQDLRAVVVPEQAVPGPLGHHEHAAGGHQRAMSGQQAGFQIVVPHYRRQGVHRQLVRRQAVPDVTVGAHQLVAAIVLVVIGFSVVDKAVHVSAPVNSASCFCMRSRRQEEEFAVQGRASVS